MGGYYYKGFHKYYSWNVCMAHYNRTNTRYIMETGSGKHTETIVRYNEYGNPSDIYEKHVKFDCQDLYRQFKQHMK